MTFDLLPEMVAALRVALADPATVAALRPIIREEMGAALAAAAHDRRLTIAQAAQHCGMSAGAFNVRMGKDGELAKLRLGTGRLTRFRASDLDAWLAGRQSQRKRQGKAS